MTISHERLIELLRYDELTGHFYWKARRSPRVNQGDIAGATEKNGVVTITIDYIPYTAHQLAWFYMTREWAPLIDHRDRCRSNNAWMNLRKATRSQNRANSCSRKNRKLALPKGVTFCHHHKKFRAQIYKARRRRLLGYFETSAAAAAAYQAAAIEMFGEFARAA